MIKSDYCSLAMLITFSLLIFAFIKTSDLFFYLLAIPVGSIWIISITWGAKP